ncbi:MAG TPA: VCBS repeat-containing protein [Tepidisphaeraceae bacterium]|jgi:hypothetical protein
MSPQLVDLDNDGNLDLLSGSYAPGELFLFRNRGDQTFARPKRVRDKDGACITVGAGTTAFAADWDDDRRPDIIVGTMSGELFLIPNIGTREKASFGAAMPLTSDGRAIRAGASHAAPAVADWDGDGLPDLFVGTGQGSVLLYRGIGRDESHKLKLAPPRTLVPASTADANLEAQGVGRAHPWGGFVRVNVADFNGDGRADLLVGDVNDELIPIDGMSSEQEKEHQAAEAEYRKAEQEYRATVTLVTSMNLKNKSDDPNSCDFSHDPRVVGAREKMEAAQEKRLGFYSAYKRHGYVWLFQRKPASQASR